MDDDRGTPAGAAGAGRVGDDGARGGEGWLLLVVGLIWLFAGFSAGGLGLLLALPPGVLLSTTGAAQQLWGDDPRFVRLGALGAVGGIVLAVVELLLIGLGSGVVLAAASAAALVAAGRASLRGMPRYPGVPEPRVDAVLSAKVAVDEAMLSTAGFGTGLPTADRARRIRTEIDDVLGLYRARGWHEKPETYHRTPLPLETPRIARASTRGIAYEHLSFDSEYEPYFEEPGRERWLGYTANRTAHAWVLRHAGTPRPWLVCIHGYRMGSPSWDLGAFDPKLYHHQLGLNLVMPVLPLHGPRKTGRRSGEGFLTGNALDTVHAEAQAMWDVRRLLSWVRAQDPPAVGVLGLSLGGYNTALLASLEDGLACAIAGIPATDLGRLFFGHAREPDRRALADAGLAEDVVGDAFRVISPLAIAPKVSPTGRAIFAGVADRLVPPDHAIALYAHWGEPTIAWYQGGHMTFARDAGVKSCVRTTLERAGLVAPR